LFTIRLVSRNRNHIPVCSTCSRECLVNAGTFTSATLSLYSSLYSRSTLFNRDLSLLELILFSRFISVLSLVEFGGIGPRNGKDLASMGSSSLGTIELYIEWMARCAGGFVQFDGCRKVKQQEIFQTHK